MNPRIRPSLTHAASIAATMLTGASCLLGLSLLCASVASAEPHLRGLTPNELSIRATCATAPPGYARCASEQLIYKTSEAPVRSIPASTVSPTASPAITPAGYGPSELQSAYNLTTLAANQGSGKTIAVVDAYDDPNAEADLAVYRSHYELPSCKAGCFTKTEQPGTQASPTGKNDWSVEISLDLDMASAICPKCHLLLEEAKSPELGALAEAAHTAATTTGVVAVSNSYAANENEVLPKLSARERTAYESDYKQSGVAFTAAAGDTGYEVNVPAVLSTVTAVGGTSLQRNGDTWSETAWLLSCEGSGSSQKCTGTGGGCSEYVTKPAWQVALGSADAGCEKRTDNDLSADANPDTGAAVYDTDNGNGGWEAVGGTSESSPIAAGFYALIGDEAGVGGAAWDYEHPSFFRDVVGGLNQLDCTSYLCEAITGFDGPTGLGTPDGTGGQESPTGGGEEENEPVGEEPGGNSEPGSELGKEKSKGSEGGGKEEVKGPSEEGTGTTEHQPETETGSSGASPTTGAPPTSPLATATSTIVPVLSAPTLTKTATAALSHGKPKVSRIAFAFTLNVAARVKVTLAKLVRVHGHSRWVSLPVTLTFAAAKGRDQRQLTSRDALTRWRYRLTLTPQGGTARTLTFQVG